MRTGRWGSLGVAVAIVSACTSTPVATTGTRTRTTTTTQGGLPPVVVDPNAPKPSSEVVVVNPGSPTPRPSGPSGSPASLPPASPAPLASPSVAATAPASPSPAASAVVGDPNASGIGAGAFQVRRLVGSTAGFLDGNETNALFNHPVAMALDITSSEKLRLFVADAGNQRIRQVEIDGGGLATVTTYAGTGVQGDADASKAVEATFRDLRGLTCGPDGTLYVADAHRIRRIAPSGDHEVLTLAGGDEGKIPADNSATGVPGLSARFRNPSALVVTTRNTLMIADTNNHRLQELRLAEAGFPVYNAAGSGVAGYSNGDSLAAQMDSPNALAVDIAGTLYFTDKNHRIRALSSEYVVSLVAGAQDALGAGTAALGDADGAVPLSGVATGRFNFSAGAGLAADPRNPGSLYVVEPATHRLRLVHQGQLRTLAGQSGQSGVADAAATAARFNAPAAVVYKELKLTILDTGNERLRQVVP